MARQGPEPLPPAMHTSVKEGAIVVCLLVAQDVHTMSPHYPAGPLVAPYTMGVGARAHILGWAGIGPPTGVSSSFSYSCNS